MATKTISIDMDAYRRLRAVRGKHESFSQAIKRVIQVPLDMDAYVSKLDELTMSPKSARAVRQHMGRRPCTTTTI
jgi:predicted CopG family antitoxin